MRHRRLLLLVAMLLVFVANAPNAAAPGFEAFPGHRAVVAAEAADRASEPDMAAKLTTAVALQRTHPLASRVRRVPGDGGGKVLGLCVPEPFVADHGCAARIDADAGARLDASSTPCCVRGPPAAA